MAYFHQVDFLVISLHSDFSLIVIFISSGSRMPNAPLSFGKITCFHLMRWNFFLFDFPPCQRNLRIFIDIWLIMPRRANKEEHWYRGRVAKTALMSVTCLVGFSHYVPQWINSKLMFSTICNQSCDLEVFMEIGIHIYQKDDHLSTRENWKTLEIACIT